MKTNMNQLFDLFREEFADPIKEEPHGGTKSSVECQHEFVHTDEFYECRHCHRIQPIFVDSIDAPLQSTYIFLKYQPLTHFKSRLSQLQGKENKQIPENIIELCQGCKNYKEVLKVLKTHKKPQYYKHKIKILNELGQRVPSLTIPEEQKIIDIFKQRFPMRQNKNSIPYQFVLFKILSLIKREDLHPFIELTKNKTKIKKYETIFSQLKL
jgi:hypothetical protein